MIVSIHQPHFLPWMGYLNKLMQSDAFVVLNTVQYRPRYYQNRAKVKRNNEWVWLSVPVHSERNTKIMDVKIASDIDWKKSITSTIEFLYRKKKYFPEYWPLIRDAIINDASTLDTLNINILKVLLEILKCDTTKIFIASEMPVNATDPTQRLVDICVALGATHYISGRGGREYMDTEKFDKERIHIIYQDLDFNSITYNQDGETFIPGLSIIDPLFNIGSLETKKLVTSAWTCK